MDESIVITLGGISSEEMTFQNMGLTQENSPVFTIGEVAKVFFNRGPAWIRWRERDGCSDFEGETVSPRNAANARSYTMADVEKLFHALLGSDSIDGTQFYQGMKILHAIALLHKLIIYEGSS